MGIKIEPLESIVKDTIIISAFPGTGKSHFFDSADGIPDTVLDSDSSKFDKKFFPGNYISHIKEKIGKVDYICVSSHKLVREALVKENLPFILLYPHITLKNEYIQRYKERGNNEGFIKLLDENWDLWIKECENQEGCIKIVMSFGDHLSDFFLLPER